MTGPLVQAGMLHWHNLSTRAASHSDQDVIGYQIGEFIGPTHDLEDLVLFVTWVKAA